MDSQDILVRQLSYSRFAQYTGASINFDAGAAADERKRQVDEMKRWWNESRARQRHEGESNR